MPFKNTCTFEFDKLIERIKTWRADKARFFPGDNLPSLTHAKAQVELELCLHAALFVAENMTEIAAIRTKLQSYQPDFRNKYHYGN